MLTAALCSHCVVDLLSNEEVPVPPVNLEKDNRTLAHTDIYRQLGPSWEKRCVHLCVRVCVCVLRGFDQHFYQFISDRTVLQLILFARR